MAYLYRLLGIFVVFLSVSGCAKLNSGLAGTLDLDTDFMLELKADATINPDHNNEPSPLFVRMYELKSENAFKQANFLELYENDKDVLKAELVARHDLKSLTPGQSVSGKYVLAKETAFIGLYAEFSQYKDSGYKLIIPVVQKNVVTSHAVAAISGNEIKLQAQEQGRSGSGTGGGK